MGDDVIHEPRRGLGTDNTRSLLFCNDVIANGRRCLIQDNTILSTTADDKPGQDCSVIDATQGTHYWSERLTAIDYRPGLAMKMYPRLHGQTFIVNAWSDEHRVSCPSCDERRLDRGIIARNA
jgi:hypothetical protein